VLLGRSAPADFGGENTWLLVLLDERVRWLEAERLGHSHHAVIRDGPGHAPELPTVGELPEEWVMPVVEDVGARYPGLAFGRRGPGGTSRHTTPAHAAPFLMLAAAAQNENRPSVFSQGAIPVVPGDPFRPTPKR